MAEFDYAFLADYAAIADGKLTAVGASFTHVYVPHLPAGIDFAVAGRVRVLEGEDPPELELRFHTTKSDERISVSGILEQSPTSIPYNGKVGVLFTLKAGVNVEHEELVEVDILLNGQSVRRLAFEVRGPAETTE